MDPDYGNLEFSPLTRTQFFGGRMLGHCQFFSQWLGVQERQVWAYSKPNL